VAVAEEEDEDEGPDGAPRVCDVDADDSGGPVAVVLAVVIAAGFGVGFAAGLSGAPALRRPSRAPKPREGFTWDLEGRGQKHWFRLAPQGTSVVYVIGHAGEVNKKVGWTNNLKRRLKTFQAHASTPLLVYALAPGGEREEAAIHAALKGIPGCWVKPPKGAVMGDEWFRLPDEQAPLWRERIDRAIGKARRGQPVSPQLELEGVA
jgi:hypothetical protein